MKAAKIPDYLYAVCSYFIPRMMFLKSNHAAQIHWGDIAVALNNFPKECLDLSSSEFWENWMLTWKHLGDEYNEKAIHSTSGINQKEFYRNAAACYHWAEFMYFSNQSLKTTLRYKIKECFNHSLNLNTIKIKSSSFKWKEINIPYYLILPDTLNFSQGPFPCVILSNGLDSVSECEIFSFAEQFLSKGIATFLFDGPGQGIHVGLYPLELEIEDLIKQIIEILKQEKEINIKNLGFFGVSFGGYFALRVAKYLGNLFKGIINLSGGPYLSNFTMLPRRLKEDFKYAFMETSDEKIQNIFDKLSLKDNFDNCKTSLLSIHGALDDIFPIEGVKDLHSKLKNKDLKIYEKEAHVCLNYINSYSLEMTDWLSEKFIPHP